MQNKEFNNSSIEFRKNKMVRVLLKKTKLSQENILKIVNGIDLTKQLNIEVIGLEKFKEVATSRRSVYNMDGFTESINVKVDTVLGDTIPGKVTVEDGVEKETIETVTTTPAAVFITKENNLMDVTIPQLQYSLVICE